MIPGAVTREMTPYELKFALLVENTLNGLLEPGLRQMIVEALSILSLLASIESIQQIGWIIDIDRIVRRAEEMFLHDQLLDNGDCNKDGQSYLLEHTVHNMMLRFH